MPRIRLILEDEQGNPISAQAQRVYELEGSCETLDEIEEATQTFKREALPEIERSLLREAQQRFLAKARGEKAGGVASSP